MWYNLRNPIIQSYSAGCEQAKRDIDIKEEKATMIKNEQLGELRRKEKRIPNGSGLGKRAEESSVVGGVSARHRPYPITQRPLPFQHSRAQH